ncbi:MAG: molybdenum cofactor guanylyltransferase [Solirubrobacteraceae bacterium]|nr:molybdenum cofactor guanylyltransferase [Solirubrobacteraceae bacterium]
MGASADVVAVILAGGRGRRLGEPKMQAEIDGRPLLEIAIARATEAGLPAVVVTKPDTRLPAVAAPVLHEPVEPEHPLLGIVTAMKELPDAQAIVVLGGDLPFVPVALVRALAEADGSTVPVAAGRHQPLVARYERALLPSLEAALADDASITATVRSLGFAPLQGARLALLDPTGHAFMNVNTPDDLTRARVIAHSWSDRTQ